MYFDFGGRVMIAKKKCTRYGKGEEYDPIGFFTTLRILEDCGGGGGGGFTCKCLNVSHLVFGLSAGYFTLSRENVVY